MNLYAPLNNEGCHYFDCHGHTTHNEILTYLALFSFEAHRADAAVLFLSESGLTSGVSSTWVSQAAILKKSSLWLYKYI